MASEQTGYTNPLKVSISHIPDDGLGIDIKVAVESLQLSDAIEEAEFSEPFHLRGRFTKGLEQFYFQGKLQGAVDLPCSRCLEKSHHAFTIDMFVMFVSPASARREKAEEELDLRDEIDVYVHDGLQLDLAPAVYDQTVLALPLQPLCRSDCAGLCQVCGNNLNESSCDCNAFSGDHRFAPLQKLSFPEPS